MPDINVNKLSEALNTKADIDLNNTGVFSTSEGRVNLTSSTPADASGKEVTSADFIKSDIQSNLLNYTTNRILEIPQDIKLELNNGTLTLKAGSKVYVPNGFEANGTTPKFDVMVIANDLSASTSWEESGETFVYYKVSGNTLFIEHPNFNKGSGTTGVADGTYYYTNTNQISRTSGGEFLFGESFPLAKITISSDNKVTSIDQVFNGFGYIGSTVFALPGVKVQTPNGKNKDGTYKTVIRTVDSVKTYNASTWGTRNLKLIFSGGYSSFVFHAQTEEMFTYNKQFSSYTHTLSYDENTGYWWYSSDQSSWVKDFVNILGSVTVTSGRITSFESYTVDSVANSNASNFSQVGRSYLSGLGMPSSRYIDLTLGASGSTYTAPANGTFYFRKRSTAAGQYISLANTSNKTYEEYYSSNSNQDFGISMNVLKGVAINANYTFGGTTHEFKFVYAQGEQ